MKFAEVIDSLEYSLETFQETVEGKYSSQGAHDIAGAVHEVMVRIEAWRQGSCKS